MQGSGRVTNEAEKEVKKNDQGKKKGPSKR